MAVYRNLQEQVFENTKDIEEINTELVETKKNIEKITLHDGFNVKIKNNIVDLDNKISLKLNKVDSGGKGTYNFFVGETQTSPSGLIGLTRNYDGAQPTAYTYLDLTSTNAKWRFTGYNAGVESGTDITLWTNQISVDAQDRLHTRSAQVWFDTRDVQLTSQFKDGHYQPLPFHFLGQDPIFSITETGIKVGNTVITEEQLQRLLQLIQN